MEKGGGEGNKGHRTSTVGQKSPRTFHVFSNSSTPSKKIMIPTLLVEKLRLSEANNTLTFWNVNHGYTFWISSLSDSVLKSQETQQGVLVL